MKAERSPRRHDDDDDSQIESGGSFSPGADADGHKMRKRRKNNRDESTSARGTNAVPVRFPP